MDNLNTRAFNTSRPSLALSINHPHSWEGHAHRDKCAKPRGSKRKLFTPLLLFVSIAALFAAPSFAGDLTFSAADKDREAYGNSTGANASTNHNGDPNNNSLTFSYGSNTTKNNIYGASAPSSTPNATVSGNNLYFNSGTVDSKNAIAGHNSVGAGDIFGNTATMTGGSIVEPTNSGGVGGLFGAYSSPGADTGVSNVYDNHVIVSGGTANWGAHGGFSQAKAGDVYNNTVVIDGGTLGLGGAGGVVAVGGELATLGSANGGTGDVYNNTVTITAGVLDGNTFGASANGTGGTIHDNSVTLTGGGSKTLNYISGSIAGAFVGSNARDMTAKDNTVTITNASIGNISGYGVISSGRDDVTLQHNVITVTNSTIVQVYGAYVIQRTSGKTQTVLDHEVHLIDSSTGNVYGVYSFGYGDVLRNVVDIQKTNSGAMNITGRIWGASVSGDYTSNENIVTIANTSNTNLVLSGSEIYGGKTDNGVASKNKVVLTSGADAGITVSGQIYGGYTSGYLSVDGHYVGHAAENEVTITGNADHRITVADNVFAGYSSQANATANVLTLSGASFAKDVYGGYVSSTGSLATDNIVNVGEGVIITGKLYGGGGTGADLFTGNVLNLTAAPTSISEVLNFEQIAFGYAASGNANIAKLTTSAGQTVNLEVGADDQGDAINVTFGGQITGAGGINKTGTGKLTLTAANNFTGGVTLSEGTLAFGASGSLASTLALSVGTGATVELAGNGNIGATPTHQLSGGTLALVGASGTTYATQWEIDGAGIIKTEAGNQILAGNLCGDDGFTKEGNGTLVLTGENGSYTGTATVAEGTLQIGNGGTVGSLAQNIINNANVTFNRSDAVTFDQIISGSGSLTKDGNNTLTLTGENTYTGQTTVSAGTLRIGNNGTTGSIVGDIVNNGAVAFCRSDDLSYTGVVSGSGGFTQSGDGTLTIAGENTYTGDTIVSGGTLAFALSGSVADSASVTVNSGATIALADDHHLGSGTQTHTLAGGTLSLIGDDNTVYTQDWTIGTGGGTIFVDDNHYTMEGITLDGAGALTKTGTGTLSLKDATISHDGGTTIAEGNLIIEGDSRLAEDESIVIESLATLTFNQTGSTAQTLSGNITGEGTLEQKSENELILSGNQENFTGNMMVDGTASTLVLEGIVGELSATGYTGTITVAADNTIRFAHSSSDTQLLNGANLNIAGTLIQAGSNTVQIAGGDHASSYTGNTVVESGILKIASDSKIGDGAVTVESGGTLSLMAADNLGNGDHTLNGGTLELNQDLDYANDWILNNVSGNQIVSLGSTGNTVSGVLSGEGGVTLSGVGLTLSGNNTYQGDTLIASGDLIITGSLDSASGDSVKDYAGNITMSGAGNLIFNQTSDQTLSGSSLTLGNLIKSNTGVLTLDGETQSADRVTVTAGGLTIGDGKKLAIADAFSSGNGTVLTFNAASDENEVAMTAGTADLADGTILDIHLTGNESVNDDLYLITATDAGSFGATDTTKIVLNVDGTTYSIPDESRYLDVHLKIDDVPSGKNLMMEYGLVWYKPDANAHGTFDIGSLGFTLGENDTLDNSTTVSTPTAFNWNGKDLTKKGEGTLTLKGKNTYDGVTHITNGELLIDGNGELGHRAAGDPDYQQNIVLEDALAQTFGKLTLRQNAGITQTLSGNLISHSANSELVKEGDATLVLAASSDNSQYQGKITVKQGILSVSADHNIGLGVNTIAGGTLQLSAGNYSKDWVLENDQSDIRVVSDTATVSGALNGEGGLFKTGGGVLDLTGVNSYTGETIVEEGILKGNIASGTHLTLHNDATYDGTNAARIIGTLTSDSADTTLVNPNGVFVQEGNFAGVISDAGSLTKVSSGTLTLSGVNTYTGETIVQEGTLLMESGSAMASDRIILDGGATLDVIAMDNPPAIHHLYIENITPGVPANYHGTLMADGADLYFPLPYDFTTDDTMLYVTGGDAHIDGATLNISVNGGTPIWEVGNELTLIQTADGQVIGTPVNTKAELFVGTTLHFTFDVLTDDQRLYLNTLSTHDEVEEYTPPSPSPNPVLDQAKAISEGALAGVAFLTDAGGLAADQGFAKDENPLERRGLHLFGVVSGGTSKYETGSSVKTRGVSLVTGATTALDNVTVGGFVEWGNGSADTENTFPSHRVKGDADLRYYGVGVLGRWDHPNGFYVNGLLRAGRIENKFSTEDFLVLNTPQHANYTLKALYVGAQVGGGYGWKINETGSLDLYGRLIWTRQNAKDTQLSSGETLKFSAINSERVKVGARYLWNASESVKPYAGLAWEHDFGGKAKVSTNGQDIPAATLKGGSAIGEAGVSVSGVGSWSFDLALTGYVGKRDGVTGSAKAVYRW
ncbi:MAG: autotransporter-associated beta strand repeat-containing protein [Burkholderiales bacterium]|jgi:fibronectin-binding autotransporter adhesin|nr:autotransporter-associated beta strand repeat-containing protein [Burkholderiales bacterium]